MDCSSFETAEDTMVNLDFGEREALTMALFKLLDDDDWIIQKTAVLRNQAGVAILHVLLHSCIDVVPKQHLEVEIKGDVNDLAEDVDGFAR